MNVAVHTDVGRSCILLTIGGKNLMLDCGMHMGYNDDVSMTFCASGFISGATVK